MSGPHNLVLAPKLKPLPARRGALVSVLDFGSSKVCCLIARLRPATGHEILPGRTHAVDVVGFGHKRSAGVKSGVIVDMDAAEQAVRSAVDAAESQAGMTVESVIVNVSCGRPRSEVFSAGVEVVANAVAEDDIQGVLEAGLEHVVPDGRAVLHALPIGYSLDGSRGVRDPRGMLAARVGVDMHMVTAEAAPVRNLLLCIERCHLSVEALVVTPYASGLAALVDDEVELGAACVDIGAGATTIGVFFEGRLVHVDALAVGGHHVTLDIARGLSTRLAAAERVKTLHGSVLASASDSHETVSVPPLSEDDDTPNHVPRDMLTRIVRPRIEEILELVRDRLAASVGGKAARRVVLTGGASQLTGLVELARQILNRPVRLGRPLGVSGLPGTGRGPAFTAAAGLCVYPQFAHLEHIEPRRRADQRMTGTGGYLTRVREWFKDSF
ncbi:MAG: cell division protein FtsA [Pseudomonadota bacterium]|nr:cell division protein FtsA [Pseudomonadota bacterium]